MADYTGGLELQGLDEVLKNFDIADEAVAAAAMTGMEKVGLKIIEKAMNNLRANGSVVTGLLRQSGKVQKKDETTLEVGFFDTKNVSGYASWVEYGRKAGKMPPPDELAAYAHKKLRLPNDEAKAVGWAMAVRIAREGTQPHPFFQPAVDEMQKEMADIIGEEINKVNLNDGSKHK